MPPDRRLLPPAWWSLAGLAWVGSAMVLAGLSWHLHRTGSGGRVELTLDTRLASRLGAYAPMLERLTQLGSPPFVVGASVVIGLFAAALGWWRGAALGLLGAPLAGAITDLLLKPFVAAHAPHGPDGEALAFPSGHTTGAFGVALVLAVLLLPRTGRAALPSALRLLLGALALGLAAGTAVSVVALGYHRTTDAVGGFATATLVVLGAAAALDVAARSRARA